MLQLQDSKQFNEQILVRAAKHSEENDRIAEAIKLYNLAGDYSTVISCLAQSLSNTIARPSPDEKDRTLERTAIDILRHYERTNRAVGKDRDAVVRLLRIREAMEANSTGKPEVAIDVSLQTDSFNHSLMVFACRSWNPQTSFRSLETLRRSRGVQKSSKTYMNRFKGICRHIFLLRWTLLPEFTKRSSLLPFQTRRGKW